MRTRGCSEPPLSVIFGLGLWPLSSMLSALLCQLMTKRTVQRKLPGTLVARGNLERTPRELLGAVFGFCNQISQCSPGWPRIFSSSPSLPPLPPTARITRISSYWHLPGTRPVPSSQPGTCDLFHLSNHPLRLETRVPFDRRTGPERLWDFVASQSLDPDPCEFRTMTAPWSCCVRATLQSKEPPQPYCLGGSVHLKASC